MKDLISPLDPSAVVEAIDPAPRLRSLEGMKIALLNIGKSGGNRILDAVSTILAQSSVSVNRFEKCTFARDAPSELIGALSEYDAVIEGVAD